MSALKIDNVNTHVVDILGSTKGRDQPIMKMDKAVELVKCLDRKILESDDYVFFDPFCKAGEILLATALVRNLYKSKKGLVSIDTVFADLYRSNRYFALAPDERHYRLALRTFYGNEKSHKSSFTKNIRCGHYLSEEDGRLNKDKFKKEIQIMLKYIKEKSKNKNIIVAGNPPYQEDDGGYGKSAKPIYNFFTEQFINSKLIEEILFVIPSRWFSGGKGLDIFRRNMISSKKIKKLYYFENPHEIFPTVEIRGGICYFNYNPKFRGLTKIYSGDKEFALHLDKHDIIVPHFEAHSILRKVLTKKFTPLSSVVWPRNPFGLSGDYFRKNKVRSGNIECFYEGKKIKNIPQKIISKNFDKVSHYKVALPRNSGGGKGHRDKTLPRTEHFFILKPSQISTETYSVLNSFKTLSESKRFLQFLQTSFSRFLLSLRKPTQGVKIDTFAWIPLMDNSKIWTDEKLFQYFCITKEEQAYIKKRVEKLTA